MVMTRTKAYVLTAISAVIYVLLFWIFADGLFSLKGDVLFSQKNPRDGITVITDGTIWTYVLLALIIIAGVYEAQKIPAEGIDLKFKIEEMTPGQIHDPVWWQLLLGNIFLSVFWLPLRFFIGREWLAAGEHKLRDSRWMEGGKALVSGDPNAPGFWERIVSPEQAPNPTYGWFNDFIQYMIDQGWASWFAKLIAIGETLVGVALLAGALVGIAAFFGTFMNFNFMLAGTASTNPVLFGLSVFIILAWKVAGYWGLDRYLLPMLGTPGQPGKVVRREPGRPQPSPSPAD